MNKLNFINISNSEESYNLRILHLGNKFPDARVEKCMISDKRRGDLPAISILRPNQPALKDAGEFKQFKFNFGAIAQFGIRTKPTLIELKQHIEEFDPDIIHAHDIYNAVLAYKLDIPFLYNDHEAWSFKIRASYPPTSKTSISYWKRYIGLKFRKYRIPKWEKQVLKNRATLTVSEKLAEHHKIHGANAFVLNNYPLLEEVENNRITAKVENSIGYIGTDLSYFAGDFRDTRGFVDTILASNYHLTIIGDENVNPNDKITNHGFVHHTQINQLLEPIQYGALAFHPHPFHIFADHIKIYNYAHAGMIIIAPYTFEIPGLLEIRKFKKFSEIPNILKIPIKTTPQEIREHALKNFIWEKREESIHEAVKFTVENN